MTYEQFTKVGSFGCADGYNTFKGPFIPLLKRLHGGNIGIMEKFLKELKVIFI